MAACEQLAERYQICMEEGREFEIDDLLQECERHHREGTLREFISESLSEKGVNAASFISGSGRRKNFRCFMAWNVCVRSGIRCLMEWKAVVSGKQRGIFKI